MSISKFPNSRSEFLYTQEPDDQVGDSSEGLGWAGLFVREGGQGGEIIVEESDGAMRYFDYASEDEMREAWHEFERSLEIKKPEEDDYMLVQYGDTYTVYRHGSNGNKALSSGHPDREAAKAWCAQHAETVNFLPDVWEVIGDNHFLLGE